MGGDLYSISTCWLHGQLVAHRRLLPVVCLYTICTALCCALLKMETMWKRVKRCARVHARAPLVCVPPICWIEIEFWKYDWASCTRCVTQWLCPDCHRLVNRYYDNIYSIRIVVSLLIMLAFYCCCCCRYWFENRPIVLCVCAVHCCRFHLFAISIGHAPRAASIDRKKSAAAATHNQNTNIHTHTPDNKLNQFPR